MMNKPFIFQSAFGPCFITAVMKQVRTETGARDWDIVTDLTMLTLG